VGNCRFSENLEGWLFGLAEVVGYSLLLVLGEGGDAGQVRGRRAVRWMRMSARTLPRGRKVHSMHRREWFWGRGKFFCVEFVDVFN
jgi:hypothetical protein